MSLLDGQGDLALLWEARRVRKEAEAQEASLKARILQRFGTGKQDFPQWLLNVNSYTRYGFDREAAERELGPLSRFDTKPAAVVLVEVKPNPAFVAGAIEARALLSGGNLEVAAGGKA